MMRTLLRFTLSGVIAVAALLPAGITASADVKRDINDLKQNSYQSRKDISENRKQIETLRAELNRLKGAQSNIPSERSLKSIRSSQTTLLDRVNELHEEVQTLMGQVEQELNNAKKLSRQTAADLDVVKASAGKEALEKRLSALKLELAMIKKKLEMIGAATNGRGVTAAGMEVSAEDEYKAAYDLFKRKKHSEARKSFEAFIKKNKQHKWAGNAHFWIGESHYAEGKYDSAILSYDDVIRKYPKSNKVPDAMLKQGYAFINLKDSLAAKGSLQELVQKYPDSQAAKKARNKLKTLK